MSSTRHTVILALVMLVGSLNWVHAEDTTTLGELIVEPPTLICLGFVLPFEGDDNINATAELVYRKKGETTWRKALPPMRTDGRVIDYNGAGAWIGSGGKSGHSSMAARFKELVEACKKDDKELAETIIKGRDEKERPLWYLSPLAFAGSIFDLESDTEYECKVKITDKDGVKGEAERVFTARTRAEPQPYAKGRIRHLGGPSVERNGRKVNPQDGNPVFADLTAAYEGTGFASSPDPVQPGDIILVHAGVYKLVHPKPHTKPPVLRLGHWAGTQGRRPKNDTIYSSWKLTHAGEPGKPITIKAAGDGEAVFDGQGANAIFDVREAHHHIFEGLTVRNGECAFWAGSASRKDDSRGYDQYFNPGEESTDAAVRFLTIRRCHIEDFWNGVTCGSNKGRGIIITDCVLKGRLKDDISTENENSAYAVELWGKGHTVCYNDISASFDAVDFRSKISDVEEERTSAVDCYNNRIHWIGDNMIIFAGYTNQRAMRNLCIDCPRQVWGGQPVMQGPAYFIRNIAYRADSWKNNLGPVGLVVYHNTMIPYNRVGFEIGVTNNKGYLRNANFVDILFDTTSNDRLFRFGYLYNFFVSGNLFVDWRRDKDALERTFVKVAPINDKEKFPSPRDYDVDVRLRENSPAIDAANEVLPNVNDDFLGKAPDLGAIEFGKPLPHYGPRTE
jgi:hypothetical protein